MAFYITIESSFQKKNKRAKQNIIGSIWVNFIKLILCWISKSKKGLIGLTENEKP